MSRKVGWEKEYCEFTQSRKSTSFEFGKHDCCITACDVIQIITGTDPGEEFRGYDSPLKAFKFVKEYGDIDKIAEAMAAKFGWQEVHPNFAKRADVVCVDTGNGRKALGWIDLDGSQIMAVGMIGFQKLPRSKAIRAWRIE